jgi:hypothetical protein
MQRVRIRQEVGATFVGGSSRGKGRLYDVSADGFFIFGPLLLRRGTLVSAVFRTEGGKLSMAEGRVCWNTACAASPRQLTGFGVRLTRSDRQYRRLVETAMTSDADALRSGLG